MVTLLVGVGIGVSASADHAEWEELEDLSREERLAGTIEGKSMAANVLFGVGGTLAAASVALYFLEPWLARRSARRQVHLGPLEGGASGLSLRGSF